MFALGRFLIASVNDLLRLFVILVVRCYQMFISPLLGARCRYQPTCSEYALLAVRRFGPWIGCWKALRRLLRCHPWAKGGWDPP